MKVIVPILGAIGTAVTGPIGAAAGGSLAAASAGLGVVSTVAGVLGSLQQANFQKQVARNYAQTQLENAQKATYAAARNAQDKDAEAAAFLGDVQARQADTGFSVTSPSFQRVLDRNRIQAKSNSQRIIESGQNDAKNYLTQGQNALNETKGLVGQALLKGVGAITESLIGGATLIRKEKVNSLVRSTA